MKPDKPKYDVQNVFNSANHAEDKRSVPDVQLFAQSAKRIKIHDFNVCVW